MPAGLRDATPAQVSFRLNAERVDVAEHPARCLLDLLRLRYRLVGTKEGCREGECGACVVLVGRLDGAGLRYRPMTSCLVPIGELAGAHVVTVEGLDREDGLSVVQEALVAEGATQCGFCIPGIVVSLTHCLAERRGALTRADVKAALGGHLCRCTGYAALVRAGERLRAGWEEEPGAAIGADLGPHLERLIACRVLPGWFREVPSRLAALRTASSDALGAEAPPAAADRIRRIAGGTDVYLQDGDTILEAPAALVPGTAPLGEILERDGVLELGARVTFEALAESPAVRRLVPDVAALMLPIASRQIRARATLGGNVVNASPIGDMTILLLALGAEVELQGAHGSRRLPLEALYDGYKRLALAPDEIVTRFRVPLAEPHTRIGFEKVAKRRCLDIASVNSALRIECRDGVVTACRLAMGGVAPIPALLARAGGALVGQPLAPASVAAILPIVQEEIAPIDDVRGSAAYKRLLARQLVIAHFTRLFPAAVPVEAFVA